MHRSIILRLSLAAAVPLSLTLVSSCSESSSEALRRSDIPVVETLTEDQIFSGDIVRSFMAQEDPQVKKADMLFLEGIDLYRNKKDVDGATDLFIRSICTYPESRSYYELGNAYMDNGNYGDAIPCFEMAEKLGYEPFSKVLYNLACAYSMQQNYDMAAEYLEFSLQAGYSNLDHIAVDEDIAYLRDSSSHYYRKALRQGMSGMSNAKKLFWLQFKKPFAKVSLPYTLDGETRSYSNKDFITFDFEKYVTEMRDEQFSRDVGATFYYTAELITTERFVALIYAEEDPYLGEESPITYRLATFTPEGKLIAKQVVAGRGDDYDNLKTAKFRKDRTVTIKTFALEYTRDTKEEGYMNNPIKSRKETGTRTLRINDDGTITEAPVI